VTKVKKQTKNAEDKKRILEIKRWKASW